jgi:hypothetical protein
MVNYAQPVKFTGFDVAEREFLANTLPHHLSDRSLQLSG